MVCQPDGRMDRASESPAASLDGSFEVTIPAPPSATPSTLQAGVITTGRPIDRASSTATLCPSEYDGKQNRRAADKAATLVWPVSVPQIVTPEPIRYRETIS